MCHRRHIEPDFGTAAKLRQLTDGKVCAVVSDNAVRNAEPGCYLDDELRSCSSVEFLMGFASTHFVNLSTATSRWVKPPLAVLKGPTMSSPQTAKGQVMGIVQSS